MSFRVKSWSAALAIVLGGCGAKDEPNGSGPSGGTETASASFPPSSPFRPARKPAWNSRLDNHGAAHPGAPGSERQRKLDYWIRLAGECPQ